MSKPEGFTNITRVTRDLLALRAPTDLKRWNGARARVAWGALHEVKIARTRSSNSYITITTN